MPTQSLKTENDVRDFVRGGLFYGAGGSCLPEKAIASLLSALNDGLDIGWIDADLLPGTGGVFSAWAMGSPALRSDSDYADMRALGLSEENESFDINAQLSIAISELKALAPYELAACVSPEISDSTTAAALVGAAKNGLKAVDGSYMSRAIPALTLTTFAFAEIPPTPIVSCDGWRNICIVKNTFNSHTAEKIGKLISEAGFGLIGMAGMMVSVSELSNILVPGTLTNCLKVGRALGSAKNADGDPIEEILRVVNGVEICRGEITKINDKSEGGYYYGTVYIDCDGEDYSYWFKNENFVVWKRDKPCATGPDIITAIDLDTLEPIANQASFVGQRIALIGVPIDAAMQRKEVYNALGPRAFGFDFDYIPVKGPSGSASLKNADGSFVRRLFRG